MGHTVHQEQTLQGIENAPAGGAVRCAVLVEDDHARENRDFPGFIVRDFYLFHEHVHGIDFLINKIRHFPVGAGHGLVKAGFLLIRFSYERAETSLDALVDFLLAGNDAVGFLGLVFHVLFLSALVRAL